MSTMGDIYTPMTEIHNSNLSKFLRGAISKAKREEALEHLASIDLSELCKEAKVEHCRATRDLRSCGRYVHYVLNSCRHASLCTECSQRCDICPICRTPIPKHGNRLRLRLYYECIEAGLIPKGCDERFQDIEDGENQLNADVERLYSLFNVAMENNLISLICHYVTDVCMDETAVSSDPVVAFLLDEVVVKDWVKRTFKNILTEIQGIYNLEVEQMRDRLSLLLKYSLQLAGLSSVLEVLGASFKGTLSAQLQDLHQLQESVSKTKQHMEIMMWCARHHFLENVRSRYANFMSWRSLVRERKLAAIKRAWPDIVNHSAESNGQEGSLFIEDALANLEIEVGYAQETEEESEIASLQKDGSLPFFRSQTEGVAGCYPFENLRAAVDILFLHGSSDLVVAKQAIFLYYLFDRHWTMPDENWRHIIDDFAATFGISRHSLLESFAFYLLDDDTNEALKEACHLLPEICGPATHPKIARVLLERQNPETALMVLRWSGLDSGSRLMSLTEAVTAVRVRVACALLSEAFTYQRMLCTKVKEKKLKDGPAGGASDDSKGECRSWMGWMEILVTEFCCLCIWRNWVDRMIELPWNSDEEKYLHKCLLDSASDDPSSTIGSLLVVFYLQRYRYIEAYQVNLKLQSMEEHFISENSLSEEVISRMRSQSHWRTGLVDKCIELLPAVQQQQLKTGRLFESAVCSDRADEMPVESSLPKVQEPNTTSLLIPSSVNSSLLWCDHVAAAPKPSVFETPTKLGWSVNNSRFGLGNGSSSVLQERLSTNPERGQQNEVSVGKILKFDDIFSPRVRRSSPSHATPFKEITRSSSRALAYSHLQDTRHDKISAGAEQNGFSDQLRDANSPYLHRVAANPMTTPSGNLFKDSQNLRHNTSAKRFQSDKDEPWNMVSPDDPMDISSSFKEKAFAVQDGNTNGELRWRSDETSDEEGVGSPGRPIVRTLTATPMTGSRRRRFARR